jgi:hypothetical protein
MRSVVVERQAAGMQHLLDGQAGVVARRQLLDLGVTDNDMRRMGRRRELVTVHPGVFVTHTGELTWPQRAWAGVLYAWPAALVGVSALRAVEGTSGALGCDRDIQLAIDSARRVVGRPGLVIERRRALEPRVLWNLGPPRIRYEEAVLDVALAAASDLDAIAVLASACGGRRTTAAWLMDSVAARSRVPRRDWVTAVLRDVAQGTCSVLEHGYLARVERPHGLPRARRQLRAVTVSGPVYRDAEVLARVVVELDGRPFHDSATARDVDLERDLDTTLDDRPTVRLGWGQVFDRPCSTARKIGRLLALHGWDGRIRSCGPLCSGSWKIPVTR